ncbi:MAG: PKD domain-containing protein [Bacteroidota bacterium]
MCTWTRFLFAGITALLMSFSQLFAQASVDFWVSDSLGFCPPFQTTFTNNSTGVNSYLWDFGDGTTSTVTSPGHTYFTAGSFTVTLIGYLNGVPQDTAYEYIWVDGPTAPILTVTPTSGCAPMTITFDATPDGFDNWQQWVWWNMGNGDTLITTSGTYTYTQPGLYQPFFWVISDSGQCAYQVWLQDTIVVNADSCLYGDVTDILCLENFDGAIDVTVQFGTPPYTFAWSNGATTEDLTGLGPGEYIVDVTDDNGNTLSDTFYVDVVGLALQVSSTTTDCNGNGGTATVTATGGVAPYAYSWTTGDQTQSIGPVTEGGYAVYVVDDNGCTDHEVVFVEYADSCFQTLSGTIYYDINQNCVQDPGEVGIAGLVQLSTGTSVWANTDGTYSIEAPPGTHTLDISLSNYPYMSVLCPVGGSHSVNVVASDISGLDFALEADSLVQDLRVTLYKSPIRPGFTHNYWLHVSNTGTVPAGGTLTLTHDGLIDFITATPSEDSYDATTDVVTWTVPTLQPGQLASFNASGSLPAGVALGTPVSTLAQIDPISLDVTPNDNVDTCDAIVVGSFDPNDKLVSPAGEGDNGDEVLIENFDGKLRYTVRFQNTGTDTAFYVVIRDQLDPDLDPSSFVALGSSHPYALTIEDNNTLVFSFNNINLPDSARDLEGSNGHVQFQLSTVDEPTVGASYENTAAIYFDFNAPIITNTVVTTLTNSVSIDPELLQRIRLYPNPASKSVTLEYEGVSVQSIHLLNVAGQQLRQWKGQANGLSTLNLEGLSQGMYFVRLETAQGPVHTSLMVK